MNFRPEANATQKIMISNVVFVFCVLFVFCLYFQVASKIIPSKTCKTQNSHWSTLLQNLMQKGKESQSPPHAQNIFSVKKFKYEQETNPYLALFH